MDAFEIRRQLINDYSTYVRSLIKIRDHQINRRVQEELDSGLLWPDPLIQLNPAFDRLDLSNEDLVRAHVYAIWLAESRLHLGRTLKDVLDLAGDDRSLEVLASVEDALNSESARLKAKARAKAVLTECRDELVFADGDLDR